MAGSIGSAEGFVPLYDGKKEIIFSLLTKDPKQAREKAQREALRTAQEFAHKAALFNPAPVDQLAADEIERIPVVDGEEEKPYTIQELQTIFKSPVFSECLRPKQGTGEAAYWIPIGGLRGLALAR